MDCPDFPLIRYEYEQAAESKCYGTFGGDVRERYEYTRNPAFGADPQDKNGVWLQRLAAHADLRPVRNTRVFIELHSAIQAGRAEGPSPVDENELDLQNAFVELSYAVGEGVPLSVRLGRQELGLGSSRLISIREGPNVRRTMDGLRLSTKVASWTIDALAVRPRREFPGVFDDETDDTRALWGVYVTRNFDESGDEGVDVYYLGHQNDNARFAQGVASERRHTVGVRVFGMHGNWEWNFEPMLQFGTFGAGDILAWGFGSETSYGWPEAPLQPRLSLRAGIASGDRDPSDEDLGTFSAMYPRGNYYSEEGTLGAQNYYNAHFILRLHPHPSWEISLGHNSYWRLSREEGAYRPSGGMLRAPQESRARAVASVPSVVSEWKLSRELSLLTVFTRLSPRRFIEETGPSEPLDYFELTARFTF